MTARARLLRLLLLGGAGTILGLVAGLVWFGAWYYPALGLSGIPKSGYRQAMDIAARGMTRSVGLEFQDFDFVKFRPVERGGEAYVWGVARCRAGDGSTAFFWIYLEWSRKRDQWLRNYSLELAAPDDEIYFTREFPGQLTRARLAVTKLLGQLTAHVREARGLPPPAPGLPTPGL